ncbi:uncharacterized protein LOC115994137 isoform X3 [Quercus lobata]|uniref:uncharacterized protein LOC115994137 isoform X3 n=1 Tax=Quercus lobata TaxID=97700 RepID=UPI001245B494|nr:uncharacterized protein LOC115994137 isoform X3 [Quercus lobata]
MALSLTTIRLCSWPWPSRDRFATTSAEKHVWKKNREEKERRRRRKEGYWQQKFQGLLSIPSQIAEKRAWEGSFSQIADTQDFMLNLEEREEREGKRKVASDNELNFRKWKDLYGYTKGPANAFGVVVEQNLSNDQEGLTPCF